MFKLDLDPMDYTVHGILQARTLEWVQIVDICWIIEKARKLQKNIYFWFIDYAKAFDCVDNKLWTIFKEMGIPDHLTCLLRNPYADQEPDVEQWRVII